ncbi:MAG: NUDIX hydrolase [Paracoccaceae bacterium]
MIRRYGESVVAGQKYGLRPGAYAILIRDGALLLTRQAEPEPEFQLPGGGIDPGESPLCALHREVFEETGWSIAAPRRLGAFRRFVFMPEYDRWAEKICHIYLARPALRQGPPRESGHSAHWLPPAGAVDILGNPGDRAFLARFLGLSAARSAATAPSRRAQMPQF